MAIIDKPYLKPTKLPGYMNCERWKESENLASFQLPSVVVKCIAASIMCEYSVYLNYLRWNIQDESELSVRGHVVVPHVLLWPVVLYGLCGNAVGSTENVSAFATNDHYLKTTRSIRNVTLETNTWDTTWKLFSHNNFERRNIFSSTHRQHRLISLFQVFSHSSRASNFLTMMK